MLMQGSESPSLLAAAVQAHLHREAASDEPVMFFDLAQLSQRLQLWREHLPEVTPHYAVKCNPDARLLQRLCAESGYFDCASPAEMLAVLSLGADPAKIVYSHPIKPLSHLLRARELGVGVSVFDSEEELRKIAKTHPQVQLLLRISCADSLSLHPMSNKFGAKACKYADLLSLAHSLKLDVRGVHFHVGSGCCDVSAYRTAVREAAKVFSLAKEIGFQNMEILDIGGGFPCVRSADFPSFEEIAVVLKEEIAKYPFGRVIAEPGRFLAGTVCSLLTKVTGKRVCGEHMAVFINDSIWNSFCDVFWSKGKGYDFDIVKQPEPCDDALALSDGQEPQHDVKSVHIFGATCDGTDVILEVSQSIVGMRVSEQVSV